MQGPKQPAFIRIDCHDLKIFDWQLHGKNQVCKYGENECENPEKKLLSYFDLWDYQDFDARMKMNVF